MKVYKPGLALLLFGAGGVYCNVILAADWDIKPALNISETYSDNIAVGTGTGAASNDFVTQISPAIAVKGDGNRLKLDSSYSLQNIVYANNSSHNRTYNQWKLGADAELIEEFFYLSVDGQRSQRLLTPGLGVASDNLNINSGRQDVVTSRIEPSIKRRLGKYVELDLSYAEGAVNYDSNLVGDARLQDKKFSLGRSREPSKFDWQVNYSQSRQWAGELLRSEREKSAVTLNYNLFDHFSLIANGGKEEGQISGSLQNYRPGSYWSAGLMWRPSPHFSIRGASGDRDTQGNLLWAPNARTSLSATYLDREVGVQASNTWTATLNHNTRRTRWLVSHRETITSSPVLAIVGHRDLVAFDKKGEPIRDEFDIILIYQEALFGVVDAQFLRKSNQGSFTYVSRKNDLSLGVNSEQRRYEQTNRQAQVRGGFLGWRLRLSARTTSDVKYSVNKITDDSLVSETGTKSLTWSLSRALGRRITTGVELRKIEVDGATANLSRSENRLSANARVVF